MLPVTAKWFTRIVIVVSAFLCLCFLPLSFFVGGMSVGVGPSVPFLSIVIIFFPVIIAVLLVVALIWLEHHPRYFPHGAAAILALGGFLGLSLPRSVFIYVADYFIRPTPEQMRTLGWARRYEATGPAIVEFTIDAARFRVPRGYLLQMNDLKGGPQYSVRVVAHVPDMRPLDQTAGNCVLDQGPYQSNPCGLFQFFLGSGSVPTPDEQFALAKAHFPSPQPVDGPFGFEEYDSNVGEAYFRKVVDGQTYIYHCRIVNSGAERSGVCNPATERAAPAGGTLFFSFAFSELGNIVQIDMALRHLVNSFIVQ